MREKRAKEASLKVVSLLLANLGDQVVQKIETQKAQRESSRKRKAIQRENETEDEMNHRMDKDILHHRQKRKQLTDPVDKWIKRRELEIEQHGNYINPRYIDKEEETAVEKYFDVRDLNREKIANWRATIPDEQYKAYMDSDADRKRKERASNNTTENFEKEVQRSLDGIWKQDFERHMSRNVTWEAFYRLRGPYPLKDPAVQLLPIPENSRRHLNNIHYQFGKSGKSCLIQAEHIQDQFKNDTSEYMKNYLNLLSQLSKLEDHTVIRQIEEMYLRLGARQKFWKRQISKSFSKFNILVRKFHVLKEKRTFTKKNPKEKFEQIQSNIYQQKSRLEQQMNSRESMVEEKIGQWNIDGLNSKLISAARFKDKVEPYYNWTKTDDNTFFEKLKVQLDPKWKWKILSDWNKWHNWLEQTEADFEFCNVKNKKTLKYVDWSLNTLKTKIDENMVATQKPIDETTESFDKLRDFLAQNGLSLPVPCTTENVEKSSANLAPKK